MPGDRMAPTEEVLNGVQVPLPIYPIDIGEKWDEHHAAFESSDERLQGWNHRPVRWSRIQYGPQRQHRAYHRRYDGIWLPESEEQYFTMTLLNAANYMPDHAVRVSRRQGERKVLITDDLRSFMYKNRVFRQQRGRKWAIGFYFAHYILENGLDAIRETQEVAEFVEASSHYERQLKTYSVIRAAANVVLESVEPVYETARKKGSIRRTEPTAVRFLMRHFEDRQPDYVPDINRRLAIA